MNRRRRISIIDDQHEVRNALLALLEAHGFEVCSYENPLDFFEQFSPAKNLCVITDYKMNHMDGLEVLQKIRKIDPHFPVIVVSAFANVNSAVTIMKSGAHTLIQKPYEATLLLQAIDEITIQQGRKGHSAPRPHFQSQIDQLTEEEIEVLHKMIEGKPTKAIAMEMDLSTRTVDRRRSSINKKLNTNSLAELAMVYVESMAGRKKVSQN